MSSVYAAQVLSLLLQPPVAKRNHIYTTFYLPPTFARCAVRRYAQGIIKTFKTALVWGVSVKHRPQRVGKEHVLEDEDVVQIVKKV
jgi:hypothetical protein